MAKVRAPEQPEQRQRAADRRRQRALDAALRIPDPLEWCTDAERALLAPIAEGMPIEVVSTENSPAAPRVPILTAGPDMPSSTDVIDYLIHMPPLDEGCDQHLARCREFEQGFMVADLPTGVRITDTPRARAAVRVLPPVWLWYSLNGMNAEARHKHVLDTFPGLYDRTLAILDGWFGAVEAQRAVERLAICPECDPQIRRAAARVESELRTTAAFLVSRMRARRAELDDSRNRGIVELRAFWGSRYLRAMRLVMTSREAAELVIESLAWNLPPCPELAGEYDGRIVALEGALKRDASAYPVEVPRSANENGR